MTSQVTKDSHDFFSAKLALLHWVVMM